jgi:malate dehydrogenase (oxaloacetate-decarboxylating)
MKQTSQASIWTEGIKMPSQKGLEYRRKYRGLIGVEVKVPVKDRYVLGVVYTPGVAEPCKEIAKDVTTSFDYTCRGNTVALVTDGSRVIGMGDLGPGPALPVLEGKSVIFKDFAGIDAFPICLDTQNIDEIVKLIEHLAPTFGAVCLEDICAPRCFVIEEKLKGVLDIPVMHNDQHAAAVLALACLINTLRITGKRKERLSVVINGAGAGGLATARLLLDWGVRDIVVVDTHGTLYPARIEGMNWIKQETAGKTNPRRVQGTLADTLEDADVFIGFSTGGVLNAAMVATMAPSAAVLAFAYPEAEIGLQEARDGGARIVARSTTQAPTPNELNVAMVFPGIFRGMLAVGCRDLNLSMRLAAAQALADLVPKQELREDYIIPELIDFRTAPAIAAAVAEAAIRTGVARKNVDPQQIAEETERFVYEGHFTIPPKSERAGNAQEESLDLHKRYRGVVGVKTKIPVKDHHILKMLYLPPAATEAPKIISRDPLKMYEYTCKSNLIAVVSDGSAVLGLGNIGGAAAMPVMEGKCVLFQTFGAVEAYPICLATQEAEEIIGLVKAIAPGFGGINLEDIGAPKCFAVEKALIEALDIPVFHDDQHGTAVVTLAGLLNAAKVVGKEVGELRVAIGGAGAAALAVTRMLQAAGVTEIVLCDRRGAVYQGREEGMNPYKEEIAAITNPDRRRGPLEEIIQGMDVFVGLSAPGLVTEEMVRTMAEDAIVFAMANPIPEIMPDRAQRAGARVVATGRSDFPNQVNNCLGFPGIFRGALDVMATTINEEMKLAAAEALAAAVPETELGPEFIIPEAMDLHVPPHVAAAVARAAMDSGVARRRQDPEAIHRKTLEYLLEGGVLRG